MRKNVSKTQMGMALFYCKQLEIALSVVLDAGDRINRPVAKQAVQTLARSIAFSLGVIQKEK